MIPKFARSLASNTGKLRNRDTSRRPCMVLRRPRSPKGLIEARQELMYGIQGCELVSRTAALPLVPFQLAFLRSRFAITRITFSAKYGASSTINTNVR